MGLLEQEWGRGEPMLYADRKEDIHSCRGLRQAAGLYILTSPVVGVGAWWVRRRVARLSAVCSILCTRAYPRSQGRLPALRFRELRAPDAMAGAIAAPRRDGGDGRAKAPPAPCPWPQRGASVFAAAAWTGLTVREFARGVPKVLVCCLGW